MPDAFAFLLWIVLLGAAYPYVQRVRNPETRPLAAYLIFITLLSIGAGLLYTTVSGAVYFILGPEILKVWWAAVLFLATIFVPPIAFARWFLKKPPRKSPPL